MMTDSSPTPKLPPMSAAPFENQTMNETVFILGAGASFADTLSSPISAPLATQFFTRERVHDHWPRRAGAARRFEDSSLCRVLKHYFDSEPHKRSCNVNVEEIYSFLDTSRAMYRSSLDDALGFERARTDLLLYVGQVIFDVGFQCKQPRLHSTIARSIRPSDSIITFNWDLLGDKQLAKTVAGRKLLSARRALVAIHGLDAEGDITARASKRMADGVFLKLHGSVDMAICDDQRCPNWELPLIDSHQENFTGWPCPSCGGSLEIFLIPPHVNKTYNQKRFVRLQVRLAAKKLMGAREVVFIGYSFPPGDYEASAMFRLNRLDMWDDASSMWLQRVVIVNPETANPVWMSRVKHLLGLNKPRRFIGGDVALTCYRDVTDYLATELKQKRRSGKHTTEKRNTH
jgi:hypothetical protein